MCGTVIAIDSSGNLFNFEDGVEDSLIYNGVTIPLKELAGDFYG